MSGYEGRCPSCGAAVVFQLGASLLRVCEHCGVAVARKGADLAAYGRVAELIPTPSVLTLGAEGDYAGAPPFHLVGRLQLDYGAGTWDEWLMAFRNDTWAWLSESQGKFHYMGQSPLPPVPRFEEVRVGQTIDLGPPGVFLVAEVRTARFMTAAGELPFDVEPGSLLHYVDLSGPDAQFATLDYGTGSVAEALYVGREVALAELGFKDLPAEEDRRKKVAGLALSCTQCGGPLEIRAPDQTQRVACPYCGSLLDATKDFAVLEALASVPVKPVIPLGSKGRIDDVTWTVIGFLERSVTFEEVRYPWQEYLLYEERQGFRWLVASKGHWSYVEPAHVGDVAEGWGATKKYRGQVFKHFQGGRARVDNVLGEFYWAVARGDEANTEDYTSPPHLLSRELTVGTAPRSRSPRFARTSDRERRGTPGFTPGVPDEGELTYSFGTYKDPEEIRQAFGLSGDLPECEGVAPHQLWPWRAQTRGIYAAAVLVLGVIGFLYIAFSIVGGRTVHTESVSIVPTVVPGSPESAAFAGPLTVESAGNLQIKVRAPVDNTWLYLEGALINENTGAVDEFDLEVSYYHGRDSDGSWSEGGMSRTRYIPAVPPGQYLLRLVPQWEAGRQPPRYELTVRSRVPRFYQAFLAALAVVAWPGILAWRHMRFEYLRWSESDHPWVTSSEDDE